MRAEPYFPSLRRLTVVRRSALGATAAVAVLLSLLTGCSADPAQEKAAHLRKGDDYVKANKLAEAIIEYRSAIQIDPQLSEAHLKLADVYTAAGEGAQAVASYLKAADAPHASVEAQLKAGHVLILASRFGDARTRAMAVLEKEPENAMALLLLGNALAGLKNFDEAIAANRRAIALDPKRAGMYVNLGSLEYIKGDAAAAEAAYKSAIAADPSSILALVALAEFYAINERPGDAERTYLAALQVKPDDEVASRALAMFYVESGRWRQAEAILRRMAGTRPSSKSLFDLTDFLIATNRREEAAKMLEVMAKKPEAFVDASLKRALIASIEGRSTDALALVTEVLARVPSSASALALRAQIYLRDGRREQALVAATAAVKAAPRSAAAQFALGQALKASGSTAAAKNAFLETLALNSNSTEALLELVDLHLQARLTDSALEYAEQAVRLNPDLAEARLARARALATQPQLADQASAELTALQREYPRSPAVHLEAGRIAVARKDSAGARRAFTRAAELDPGSLDPVIELVKVDLGERKDEQARLRVEAALRRNPDAPTLLVFAGKAYVDLDLAVAEKYLLRAIKVDASNLEAYETLIIVYVSQRRLPEARRQFEALSEQQPTSPSPPTMVGVLYQAEGNLAKAEEWFERALRVSPRAATAANNLAWLYADQGKNLDLAMQFARSAYDELRTQPEVIDTLGYVHLKKGMPETAAKHFQEALDLSPNNPVYLYHLGLAYAQTGDHAKARTALQAALKSGPGFRYAAEAKAALAKLLY